jgi:hypothetical protein
MTTIVKKRLLKGWVNDEPTECMIEIEIDDEGLAHLLGEKAYCNKSKRTRLADGYIKCTVRATRDRAADL